VLFEKILIANRGEIALRIIRACRELGIRSVVAHSDEDRDSLPVRLADESFCIGPAPTARSYLNIPSIITAALVTRADAIHPGYGFLSENIYFAEICEKCHVTFIGPRPDVIATMSDKAMARERMAAAGLPVLPGTNRALRSLEEAQEVALDIGYPVILKAAAGGGGRGMRVVESESELGQVFPTAQAEAQGVFGSNQLYMERYLERCRHIEIQVIGDRYGHMVHLGERDCSIQRRHQKIVEESPSPAMSPQERATLGELAVSGALAVDYSNAGTLEFLRDQQGRFFFLEMNTRIQVEHGVTEQVTGIDLVKEQILVAAGHELGVRQSDVKLQGHAIECRITAEDPDQDFAPRFGTVTDYAPPGGPGIRLDTHLHAGYRVPIHYDSLLAKVIAWGRDRDECVQRMARALDECVIGGVPTNVPFLRRVMADPTFRSGDAHTDYVAGFGAVAAGAPA
jgi:acetyl-CoA carboxylase biotin carboxylase subunit